MSRIVRNARRIPILCAQPPAMTTGISVFRLFNGTVRIQQDKLRAVPADLDDRARADARAVNARRDGDNVVRRSQSVAAPDLIRPQPCNSDLETRPRQALVHLRQKFRKGSRVISAFISIERLQHTSARIQKHSLREGRSKIQADRVNNTPLPGKVVCLRQCGTQHSTLVGIAKALPPAKLPVEDRTRLPVTFPSPSFLYAMIVMAFLSCHAGLSTSVDWAIPTSTEAGPAIRC